MNKQHKTPQIPPLCYIDESIYTISHQDAEIARCDNEIAQFEVDWVCVGSTGSRAGGTVEPQQHTAAAARP